MAVFAQRFFLYKNRWFPPVKKKKKFLLYNILLLLPQCRIPSYRDKQGDAGGSIFSQAPFLHRSSFFFF